MTQEFHNIENEKLIEKQNELIAAFRNNSLSKEELKKLIDENKDILNEHVITPNYSLDAYQSYQFPLIYYAIKEKNLNAVNILIRNGIKLDTPIKSLNNSTPPDNISPILYAAEVLSDTPDKTILKTLIKHTDMEKYYTLLKNLYEKSGNSLVSFPTLIEFSVEGISPYRTLLHVALEMKDINFATMLIINNKEGNDELLKLGNNYKEETLLDYLSVIEDKKGQDFKNLILEIHKRHSKFFDELLITELSNNDKEIKEIVQCCNDIIKKTGAQSLITIPPLIKDIINNQPPISSPRVLNITTDIENEDILYQKNYNAVLLKLVGECILNVEKFNLILDYWNKKSPEQVNEFLINLLKFSIKGQAQVNNLQSFSLVFNHIIHCIDFINIKTNEDNLIDLAAITNHNISLALHLVKKIPSAIFYLNTDVQTACYAELAKDSEQNKKESGHTLNRIKEEIESILKKDNAQGKNIFSKLLGDKNHKITVNKLIKQDMALAKIDYYLKDSHSDGKKAFFNALRDDCIDKGFNLENFRNFLVSRTNTVKSILNSWSRKDASKKLIYDLAALAISRSLTQPEKDKLNHHGDFRLPDIDYTKNDFTEEFIKKISPYFFYTKSSYFKFDLNTSKTLSAYHLHDLVNAENNQKDIVVNYDPDINTILHSEAIDKLQDALTKGHENIKKSKTYYHHPILTYAAMPVGNVFDNKADATVAGRMKYLYRQMMTMHTINGEKVKVGNDELNYICLLPYYTKKPIRTIVDDSKLKINSHEDTINDITLHQEMGHLHVFAHCHYLPESLRLVLLKHHTILKGYYTCFLESASNDGEHYFALDNKGKAANKHLLTCKEEIKQELASLTKNNDLISQLSFKGLITLTLVKIQALNIHHTPEYSLYVLAMTRFLQPESIFVNDTENNAYEEVSKMVELLKNIEHKSPELITEKETDFIKLLEPYNINNRNVIPTEIFKAMNDITHGKDLHVHYSLLDDINSLDHQSGVKILAESVKKTEEIIKKKSPEIQSPIVIFSSMPVGNEFDDTRFGTLEGRRDWLSKLLKALDMSNCTKTNTSNYIFLHLLPYHNNDKKLVDKKLNIESHESMIKAATLHQEMAHLKLFANWHELPKQILEILNRFDLEISNSYRNFLISDNNTGDKYFVDFEEGKKALEKSQECKKEILEKLKSNTLIDLNSLSFKGLIALAMVKMQALNKHHNDKYSLYMLAFVRFLYPDTICIIDSATHNEKEINNMIKILEDINNEELTKLAVHSNEKNFVEYLKSFIACGNSTLIKQTQTCNHQLLNYRQGLSPNPTQKSNYPTNVTDIFEKILNIYLELHSPAFENKETKPFNLLNMAPNPIPPVENIIPAKEDFVKNSTGDSANTIKNIGEPPIFTMTLNK
jgi:flagellin-like hook-associated protein FlgL